MEPISTLEDSFIEFEKRFYGEMSYLSEYMLKLSEMDFHGGRDTGEYPSEVSITQNEGKFLYSIVRLLHPDTVLEIGTADGCSAVHILQALKDQGGYEGKLISYDIDPRAGRMISIDLRDRWEFRVGNACTEPLPKAEIVFEDGNHDYESTRIILERVKANNPDVVISHDYWRHTIDPNVGVKQAFEEVFPDHFSIWFPNTTTGLGVWVRP